MAANTFDVQGRSVALVTATAKTVVGVKASTNVALRLTEASVSFDGATSSNAPALADFNRCTFATNSPGTNSTSISSPPKRDSGRAETFQFTAAHTWTTEPTVLTSQYSKYVGQFNGLAHYIHPFNAPVIIAGGQGFVITITSPNNVNGQGGLAGEE
jgi:hypothetical protein